MLRKNPCKLCGSEWHTAWLCKLRSKKPIRQQSEKSQGRHQRTRKAWFKANPPDENGNWHCYISKHPLCPKVLDKETITLEHNLSKVRRPDLRHDIGNIFPACAFDNKAKGSLSADEYMNMPPTLPTPRKTRQVKSGEYAE